MTPEEIKAWLELLQRCEDSGNDGADVYEAEDFCRYMEQKYRKPFNQLYGSNQARKNAAKCKANLKAIRHSLKSES